MSVHVRRDSVWLLMVPLLALPARAQQPQAAADSARARTRYFPIAAPIYSPETKLGGAAALTALTRRAGADSGDRPSSTGAYLLGTQKGQFQGAVSRDVWTRGNRHRFQGSVGFSRFPFDFYGIGVRAADAVHQDSAESYTPRALSAQLAAHRRLTRALYVGIGGQLQDTKISGREPGRLLDAGTVPGSRGGTVGTLSLMGSYDTRDNLWSAARGSYVQLTASGSGGDFDFGRLSVDARSYHTLRGSHVLALQAVGDAIVGGTAPFDRLPQLGGANVLRGYYQGMYRDRRAVALQAEYRSPLWRRLGVVTFAGAGTVMPRWSDFDAGDIKPAFGAGLRYALSKEERVNIRADFGFGKRLSDPYLTLGEAY